MDKYRPLLVLVFYILNHKLDGVASDQGEFGIIFFFTRSSSDVRSSVLSVRSIEIIAVGLDGRGSFRLVDNFFGENWGGIIFFSGWLDWNLWSPRVWTYNFGWCVAVSIAGRVCLPPFRVGCRNWAFARMFLMAVAQLEHKESRRKLLLRHSKNFSGIFIVTMRKLQLNFSKFNAQLRFLYFYFLTVVRTYRKHDSPKDFAFVVPVVAYSFVFLCPRQPEAMHFWTHPRRALPVVGFRVGVDIAL